MPFHIDRRTYLMIAVGVAIFVFLVGTFFGEGIADFVGSIPNQVTANVRVLAQFVVEPIKYVMLNPIVGGLVAGLLWPVAIAWVVLLFLLIVLTELGKAGGAVGNEL